MNRRLNTIGHLYYRVIHTMAWQIPILAYESLNQLQLIQQQDFKTMQGSYPINFKYLTIIVHELNYINPYKRTYQVPCQITANVDNTSNPSRLDIFQSAHSLWKISIAIQYSAHWCIYTYRTCQSYQDKCIRFYVVYVTVYHRGFLLIDSWNWWPSKIIGIWTQTAELTRYNTITNFILTTWNSDTYFVAWALDLIALITFQMLYTHNKCLALIFVIDDLISLASKHPKKERLSNTHRLAMYIVKFIN